ncbi:MAG TPA: type III PLP-dependent enzyme [Longilinea sp.]|nr:type III PLP-dependent enzyme [Longilinea sp.]
MSPYNLSDIYTMLDSLPARETPFYVLDRNKLRQNCRNFRSAFGDIQIYFSVKANACPEVLKIFSEESINFDVASWGEIEVLLSLGVSSERMIYSAPSKIPRDIQKAYEAGVRTFAFDSKLEVEKLAKLAPGSKVFARLAVDNLGSDYPLERKFGASLENCAVWMPYAKQLGLQPWGLTFHVGSQNRRPDSWARAMRQIHPLWKELREKGLDIQVIDLGGGIPGEYCKEIPTLAEIAAEIDATRCELYPPTMQFFLEPGRGLPNNAGFLVVSVINRAERGDSEWLYLDAGVFQGLDEGRNGFHYPVLSDRAGDHLKPFVLAGPTCDSSDVIMDNAMLPEDITLGDRVFLLSTGAYTTTMQRYNGMDFPGTYFVGKE